jgi:hypothetical protein
MLLVKGLPFSNVAASSVATASLPLGMSYNRVILQLGGTFTRSHLSQILTKLNGKAIHTNTGTRLQLINDYRGIGSTSTFVVVDFTEPKFKRLEDQYLGNINTAQGVTSLTMEVTIGAATNPTLTPYYELNGPAALGVIAKQILFVQAFAASGKQAMKLIDAANAGALVKRIHFNHGGNLTSVEVKKNGIVIYDDIPTAVATHHALDYGHTMQSNLFTYDPTVDNNGANMLVTKDARSLETNLTTSSSDTVTAVVEVVDVLGNM